MNTKFPDIKLVQTTDFFYPLVDDPYEQGKIACANVLSDLYAMGLTDCDNMLMLLGISREMGVEERNVVTRLMIQGFNDKAKEAGCLVTGGQTVMNPWTIIGGVATTVCKETEILMPRHAVAGDVLVLTKPLGTQVVVNAHQWLHQKNRAKWETISSIISEEEVNVAYEKAQSSMARLNRTAARLMRQFNAHAATDVTGFGLIGHGRNLVENQEKSVSFVFHSLPIIKGMATVNSVADFGLLRGTSAETSGGLLIAISKRDAEAFCATILEEEGCSAWIIGDVMESTSKTASISPNFKIIDV